MYSKKITAVLIFIILTITGTADQVLDTNFFILDKIVNNDFIKEQTNNPNPGYFDNFFAIDAAYYDADDCFYGIGICKGKNCAYYFDMKMRTKYFAINTDTEERALKYVDKTAVTKSGKIYIIDTVPNDIYYWEIDGSRFTPAGKIDYNFNRLKDIYCDENEILYILDIGKKRIYKYSPVLETFVDFQSTNTSYITYSDKSSSAWGTAKGLVVSDGNIYLIFEHSAIIKINTQGNMDKYFTINRNNLGLRTHRHKEISETWLESIALGPHGNIYILDTMDKKIHIFSENLDYICSWHDPGHPVGGKASDICFPRGKDYFFISHPWGFYSYKLNNKNLALSFDNTFIYPDLVNEEYRGITITASSLSPITLDISVKIRDKEIKIIDNIIIIPDKECTYTWDGKGMSGNPVPYGDYTLLFYADDEFIKDVPLSIKKPPVLTIFNIDGEIIDNTNREIDYSYRVADPGYLKISISSPKENPLPGGEWETFIYEGHMNPGYYSHIIRDILNSEELPDNYYSVNFYLLPPELAAYTFDSTRRSRIFIINKHDLEMGEIINNSIGFNPYNPGMNTQTAGFFLSEGAYITCDVVTKTGDIIYTPFTHTYVPAGEQTLSWDGFDAHNTRVPDGEYAFYVKAEQDFTGTCKEDTGELFVLDTTPAVINIIGGEEVAYISPDEDSSVGTKDSFLIEFSFNEPVDVECNVKDSQGNIVKSLPGYTGLPPSATGTILWGGDGDTPPQPCVEDGRYRLEIGYTEFFGNRGTKNIVIVVDNNRQEETPAKVEVFTLNTFPVNTYTRDNQFSPSIAKVGDNYVIAWQSDEALKDGYEIYARAYDSHFHPLGDEFRVNSFTENDQTEPAISGIDNGFVITWNSFGQDGSEYGVYFRRFNTDFQPVGEETRVNTTTRYNQTHPAITGIEGGFVITWNSGWHGDPDIDTTISARIFDNNGISFGSEFHITRTPAASYAFLPDIVQVPEGFIVTWEAGTGNYNIYARKYNHQGQALGGRFTVFRDNNNFNGRPSIACLADGFIIVWISDNGNTRYDTYGQKFNFNCDKTGDVFKINSRRHSYRFYPQVNRINNGCIVTWHSNIPGDDSYAVCAKILDNDCHTIIEEFQVSKFDINLDIDYSFLNTAIETNTGFIISWQSDINDGYDLFAKTYEAHTVPGGLNLTAEIFSPQGNPYVAVENFSIQGIASDAYMETYSLTLSDDNTSQTLKSENGKSIIGELIFFNILSCEKGKDYSILLEARDKAGNYREDTLRFVRAPGDDDYIQNFTIDKYYHSDTHPPLVSFTMQNPANVTLEIMNKNGVTEKTYHLGLQPATVTDYLLDISSLPDGEYYLHLIVQNPFNGKFESKLTFTIDNTDPIVSIDDFGRYFSYQENVKIPARVIEVHIKKITITLLNENGSVITTLLDTNSMHELEEVSFDPVSYHEGSYTLVLFAKDLAGNKRLYEYPVFIDHTAPSIQFILPDFHSVWTKTIIIDAVITDASDVSGYTISFINGDEELLFTGNTSHVYHEWDTATLKLLTLEGIMKFVIHDNAGNRVVVEKPVIIDNNPPGIEIIYKSMPVLINSEQYTNAQNTLFIIAHTGDDYSSVENIFYAVTPGGWIEYTEPLLFPNEGKYTIECYAADNNGNTSPVKSDTFIVDAHAPVYSVTTGEPVYVRGNDIFIPLENNISIDAKDTIGEYRSGVKKIEYKVNDGMWEEYGYDSIKIYSAGPKDIYVKITDNVDNTISEYIGTYIVDIAPPFTTFSVNTNFYYSYERNIIALGSAADITLEAVDLGLEEYSSGVYKTYYVLNDAENEYTEPFFFQEEDVADFHFYSIDNVGNTEQREPVQMSVDTLPPHIDFYAENDIFENDFVIYSKSGNLFGFKAYDNFAGVKDIFYKLNDNEYILYKDTFSLDEEADVFITYYAEDYLALKSEIMTKQLVIDETPPVTEMKTNLPLVEIDGSLYADRRYVFSWPAYDTQCGVSKTIVIIDHILLETSPFEYVFTEDGEHTIEYYSIDNLGNTEEIHEVNIITPIPDLTPPVSSIKPSYEPYNNGDMDYFTGDIVFTLEAVDVINEHESCESGVKTIMYATDGGEEVIYQGEDIRLSGQGLHEITFYAIDYAGNTGEKNYYFLTIDDSPPESELIILDSDKIYIDNVLYAAESFSIEIIAHDEYCGVKEILYRMNTGGEWKTYEEPFTLVPGNYDIEYYAVDNLGNTEEKKSISIKVITDYNIISYKTACVQLMSHRIKDYDLFCDLDKTTIGYIKGFGKNDHIFIKNLTQNHGSVFCHGNRVSLHPEERLEIELSGTYIVTTEIRNDSRDIFLYTKEEKKQEGFRLSCNGRNENPVIMGDKVYWIHNDTGNDRTYSIVEYDIKQESDTVIFITDYPVKYLKSSGNTVTFLVSEPYTDILYGYENNEVTVLFKKPVMNTNERIMSYSFNNKLLITEDIGSGEHTLSLYRLDSETFLIDSFAGKNPHNMNNYILYVEEKEEYEVLYYYNIINKVKTGIVKGKEIKGFLPGSCGDIIVERKHAPYMKSSGNTHNRPYTGCGFIHHFQIPQVLYLKYMEEEEYVRDIRYSTGATEFAYNKYCDYGDFIYADKSSTFSKKMPFPRIHQIQTFSKDLGNTDEHYLTFVAEKDFIIMVVKEKDKKAGYSNNPGYDKYLPLFSRKIYEQFKRWPQDMSIEYYEIKAGEYFSINGPGPGISPPLIFILKIYEGQSSKK